MYTSKRIIVHLLYNSILWFSCSDITPVIYFRFCNLHFHYGDVIMGAIATQITSLMVVYSTVYSDADQGKHQSSASLTFVCGIHRGPVNSPQKWPVTRKMFPFDDVIMDLTNLKWLTLFPASVCVCIVLCVEYFWSQISKSDITFSLPKKLSSFC